MAPFSSPAGANLRIFTNLPPTTDIPTTSPVVPALFNVTAAELNMHDPEADILDRHGKFQFNFQVQVPNYSVALQFSPHEFLRSRSTDAFEHFRRIKFRALDEVEFCEEEFIDLLLPFMKLLREKAPREDCRVKTNVLTLKDIEFRGFWELKCSYSNNNPVLQQCDLAHKPTSLKLPAHLGSEQWVRVVSHQEVYIATEKMAYARNRHFPSGSPPQKVTVEGQPFFYHPMPSSSHFMEEEIDEHLKILTSGLSYHDMRILPLCGIVLDDSKEVAGLLKEWHSIYEEDFLERVLLENWIDQEAFKSWVAQFDDAVHNMRQAGLGLQPEVWNVAINKNGELWIVYLKDGRPGGIVPGMHYFLKCLDPPEEKGSSEDTDDSSTDSTLDDDDSDDNTMEHLHP